MEGNSINLAFRASKVQRRKFPYKFILKVKIAINGTCNFATQQVIRMLPI